MLKGVCVEGTQNKLSAVRCSFQHGQTVSLPYSKMFPLPLCAWHDCPVCLSTVKQSILSTNLLPLTWGENLLHMSETCSNCPSLLPLSYFICMSESSLFSWGIAGSIPYRSTWKDKQAAVATELCSPPMEVMQCPLCVAVQKLCC